MATDRAPVLELADATVVKDGVPVLDSISLTIRAGDHTAILGPNGAGKSTLINLLTHEDRALARPDGPPAVRVFGHTRWHVFDLRSRLGIVSADAHRRFVEGSSLGRITGEDAVLSGFFGTHGVLDYVTVTDAMRLAAARALDRVGALETARKTLDRMSTGEARRVLIARALVTRPDALVLDEPSAGLDLVARHRLMEMVESLAAADTTLVLVTHHVEEIVPAIAHVVLMANGRIVGSGPKRSVLTSERLSAVYGAPITIEEAAGLFHARAGTSGEPVATIPAKSSVRSL